MIYLLAYYNYYYYISINKNKLNLILKEMKKNYTNLEMLVIGIEEIAKNHGFESGTDWQKNGYVYIFGGCNVPTLADVQMLCEELMINHSDIDSYGFEIDVIISQEWLENWAHKSYVPMGQFWHKKSVSNIFVTKS